MSDDAGRLRLTDPSSGGYTFDFGTVTGISETFQKSCSVTPIVTRSKQCAFPLETRTYKQISVGFTRKNPSKVNNGSVSSLLWDNATWQERIMTSLDRWQARTNGYKLVYEPQSDNPYVASINEQGYVKSLTLKTVQGRPESVQGTLEFHVGSMRIVNRSDPRADEGKKVNDFSVTISNSAGTAVYPLLFRNSDGKEVNLIDSFSLTGGPESPFEYIQMTLPRKNLSAMYPDLLSVKDGKMINDLKPGRNTIVVNMAEQSTLTLTKVKTSSSAVTLTAYCNAERLRGSVTTNDSTRSPSAWITHILGGDYGVVFKGDDLVTDYSEPVPETKEEATESLMLKVSEGTNVWFVLQVAAMVCGARAFFAQDKAYIINYADLSSTADVDLYSGDYGNVDCSMAVVGTPDLGDEGTDTVMNTLKVSCAVPSVKDGMYVRDDDAIVYSNGSESVTADKSIAEYGTYDGGTYSIAILRQTQGDVKFSSDSSEDGSGDDSGDGGGGSYETEWFNQAKRFGKNLLKYVSEPQQTVKFKLREQTGVSEAYWAPYFQPNSVARSIVDEVNEIYVNNMSDVDSERHPQKLALKTYTRSYPECTTEYTWGVLASMDLSSSTSKILSNINQ